MRKLAEVPVGSRGVGLTPFMPGEVTAETFAAKALEFMRRSGRANGEHPVVKRGDLRFDAWLQFRRGLGLKVDASRQLESLTVPAEWPWQFSLDAAAPERRQRVDVDG